MVHRHREEGGGGATTTTPTLTLGMERIFSKWTVEDDGPLYDSMLLPPVCLASILGRGMHGVEVRMRTLSDVDTVGDVEAEEAKMEKEGGNKVENPDDPGPGRRQIGLPTKPGIRETMSGNNIVGTGRRKRGGVTVH